MTTNTSTTDLNHGDPPPPAGKKSGKRGFVWVVLLLAVFGIAGYAVWRASQPNLVPVAQNTGKKGSDKNTSAIPTTGAKSALPACSGIFFSGFKSVWAVASTYFQNG